MNVFESQPATDLGQTIQELPPCPRCEEPVVRVIFQRDKPTQYFHERGNQGHLIHTDLTTDIKENNNG